ncbi:glutamate 5-kinase [bacterium]|nr:MAG: glutamate 5-kinase [bacterium]
MKTIVIKIGTSTLVRDGAIDDQFLRGLARQIKILRGEGWQSVVVTSGAVRAGLNVLKRERALHLAEKQAAAAIGQSLLMRAYRQALGEEDLHVAQMLLTRADLGDRRRFLNARHTSNQLFAWGVVPIINENDTVATEEIRVGDNDTLAALSGLVVGADKVLLLSDVDGFYLPGNSTPEAIIEAITPEIEAAAGGAGSIGGTGGMRTKLEAARISTRAGCEMVIAQGRAADVVLRVARGETIGTRFLVSSEGRLNARKSWLAHSRRIEGTLHLNICARAALEERGSSLLPVGIETVEGEFGSGSLVSVRDERGEIGRGVVRFSDDELRRIAGHKSSELAAILGRDVAPEAIHRDEFSLGG